MPCTPEMISRSRRRERPGGGIASVNGGGRNPIASRWQPSRRQGSPRGFPCCPAASTRNSMNCGEWLITVSSSVSRNPTAIASISRTGHAAVGQEPSNRNPSRASPGTGPVVGGDPATPRATHLAAGEVADVGQVAHRQEDFVDALSLNSSRAAWTKYTSSPIRLKSSTIMIPRSSATGVTSRMLAIETAGRRSSWFRPPGGYRGCCLCRLLRSRRSQAMSMLPSERGVARS